MTCPIDITFDFRSDTPGYPKRDPDAVSPTLRKYHKILWSKPLPTGRRFTLDDTTRWAYLHHHSEVGEFFLSSDTLNQSYGRNRRVAEIRRRIPQEELSHFRALMYSIGNMIVFPGRRIGGKWTINQARGCNKSIGDRFDLTLECVRRHYAGQSSPLADCLTRYADFFDLFVGFQGYVDFFLLNDLVNGDGSAVRFFLPFAGFTRRSPYPDSLVAFRAYLEESTNFILARNQRILEFARGMTQETGTG